MGYKDRCKFSELQGKTLTNIKIKIEDEDTIIFECLTGEKFILLHNRDCCEKVTIKDIVGDTNNLLNTPILLAEEIIGKNTRNDYGSQTYSFYKLRTNKGSIDITWFGESNGYYSETVDFERIPEPSVH